MVDTGDVGNQTGDLTERALESDALLEDELTIDRAMSLVKRGASDGSLAMATGAVVLWRGLRSIRRGRVRGVIPAAIGMAAVGAGVKRRRASAGESDTSTSDEAHAAAQREDQGRETGLDTSSDEFDWQDDETSSLEPAVDDESTAETPAEGDPRMDDDEEADLSDTTVADEASEATGPSAEQAQPTMSIDGEIDPETGGPRPGVLDGDDSSEVDEGDDSDEDGAADDVNAMRQDETDPGAPQSDDDDGGDEREE